LDGLTYVAAGPYEMKDAQAHGGFRSGPGVASRPREGNERERRERPALGFWPWHLSLLGWMKKGKQPRLFGQ
jgi:hypothetical protein